jgi:SAM-dependent methyltransferase
MKTGSEKRSREADGTRSVSISGDRIIDEIRSRMKFSAGGFTLGADRNPTGNGSVEIDLEQFLLPILENGNLGDSYEAGRFVETLREYRYFEYKNHIRIVNDKAGSRRLGSYFTHPVIVKHLASSVISESLRKSTKPLILDPSCGAGYFLIESITILKEKFKGRDFNRIAENCIRGIDIDPIAVELTRRNLKREFGIKKSILDEIIKCADALSAPSNLPFSLNSFDCVTGNPPYQNFSSRGSPVARLVSEGKIREAEELKSEINFYRARFPESSHGCLDRYKWFIDRGIQFLKAGGVLGYITPSTWLVLPRYSDIRKVCEENGKIIELIDFGSHAFDRAHVPASTFVIIKDRRVQKGIRKLKVASKTWKQALKEGYSVFHNLLRAHNERIPATLASDVLDSFKAGNSNLVRLGDIATLREGSHGIKAVDKNVPQRKSRSDNFPVIIDKTMSVFKSPEIGYIPDPGIIVSSLQFHEGSRFLMRKTGDRIVIAISHVETFALAHQNVYVGKINDNRVDFFALVGILGSELLTEIYRLSPGGQDGRIHAQFRIQFLNDLPVAINTAGILHRKISEIVKILHGSRTDSNIARLNGYVRELYRQAIG